MVACRTRSPAICGWISQRKRMFTFSPIDLSIVSSGLIVASEEMTVNFACTTVPTVTGTGGLATSVDTVALSASCKA